MKPYYGLSYTELFEKDSKKFICKNEYIAKVIPII